MSTNSITHRKFLLRFLKSLLILFLILVGVFWVTAWFLGETTALEILLRVQSKSSPTQLIIDVKPNDAIITLNDQLYDSKIFLIPGEHRVKVEREGFYPVEEIFQISANQTKHLNIQLMPIAVIQDISKYAATPGWDEQGKLYFMNDSERKIYNWVDGSLNAGVDTIDGAYHLTYMPTGTHAFALVVAGPETRSRLYKINLQTGDITGLLDTGFVSLGSDGETIWGFNYDLDNYPGKPVWRLKPNGSPEFLSLDNFQWAIYGEQLFVDSSNQWLAVESTKGIAVWEIASGKLLIAFENASAPVWIQSPEPGLAFLNTDQSLNFAQANFNWSAIKLLENVQSPITGTPDGTEIIFTRYNPFVGGTSFWTVDTATKGVRLLSEAKTETGSVEQFMVSYDRKKIAFVNQKNELFLVTLEP